ncbi:hypothetical protein AGMMS50249_1170 [candidate division SR1 bacterium]|nr:hypothetical protein AGMMS50249_1170 [candidate division SR1 bacterium]
MKYFHLIGLKELNGTTNQLDILIAGDDHARVKNALEKLGIIILSLDEYTKPALEFGKFEIILPYQEQEIHVITYSDTLEKSIRQMFDMGLKPQNAIVSDHSMTQEQIDKMIQDIQKEIDEKHAEIAKEQEESRKKEVKKYEDKAIKDALKIINNNIDRINQILFIGTNILSPIEKNKLKDFQDELKKIRLGSNFQKMVEILLQSQANIDTTENKVLKALDDKKFLIDRNSTVTNIDVIKQYNNIIKSTEKTIIKAPISTTEQIFAIGKDFTVRCIFFWKDFLDSAKKFTKHYISSIATMIEYLIECSIVIITIFWFITSAMQKPSNIMIYLTILGWSGLMIFIYNQCRLSKPIFQILGLILVAVCSVFGFNIIRNTFTF